MKKIIDPAITKDCSDILDEALTADVAEWLHQWFISAKAHDNSQTLTAHTITFYSRVYLEVKVTSTVEVHVQSSIPSVFFDRRGDFIDTLTGEPATRVNVDGQLAGLWIPRLQSLLATDWTHNEDCVQQMQGIWPQIVTALGLKPLTAKTRAAALAGRREPKSKTKITLGCDPEYELLRDGEVVRASSVSGLNYTDREIGADGAGSQVELRPAPGSPVQVVKNLRKLVAAFAKDYPDYELDAAGHNYACGGHIHFGGVPSHPAPALIELLDDFLGKPSLKLSGDARGSYAKVGEHEAKPWGFEYRTPPAAIFANPKIARIVLKLSRNLVARFFKGKVIAYNYPPFAEDFIETGGLTKLETEYLVNILTSGPVAKLPLRVAWSATPAKTKPTIKFYDDWAPEVKDHYSKALKGSQDVVLYGLAAERGDVATFPCPGTDLIDHKHHNQTEGSIWLGLPWKLRTEIPNAGIIASIKKHIKGGSK